jgi:hypothetical protein
LGPFGGAMRFGCARLGGAAGVERGIRYDGDDCGGTEGDVRGDKPGSTAVNGSFGDGFSGGAAQPAPMSRSIPVATAAAAQEEGSRGMGVGFPGFASVGGVATE